MRYAYCVPSNYIFQSKKASKQASSVLFHTLTNASDIGRLQNFAVLYMFMYVKVK